MLSRRVCASAPLAFPIAVCNSPKLFDMRGQKFGSGQRVKTNVRTNGRPRNVSSQNDTMITRPINAATAASRFHCGGVRDSGKWGAGKSSRRRDEKRRNAEDLKEHPRLIEQRAAELIRPGVLRAFRSRN